MLRTRTFSLLTVVAVMMTVPVIAVSALLVQFAGIATRSLAERLGAQLLEHHAAAAAADLEHFLGRVERQSDFAASRFERRTLPTDAPEAIWDALMAQLEVFPGVTATCYATLDGRMAGVRRDAEGTLMVVQAREDGIVEMSTTEAGPQPDAPLLGHELATTETAWHRVAIEAATPVWTGPFAWPPVGDRDLLMAYSRPILGSDGEIAGVLASFVSLAAIGEHLRSLPYLDQGDVLVVDRLGRLVCSTFTAVVNADGRRVALADIEGVSPRLVEAVTRRGAGGHPNASRGGDRTVPMVLRGRAVRGVDADCGASRGLDWSIVAAVPSSAYYAHAWHVQRQLLLISGAVLGVSVLLAARLGRGLARPMLRLREHVHALGEGDFDHRMVIESLREMEDLNSDLNRMAGQLRERVMLRQAIDLATEVQQSLLPRPVLRRPGLDVCGQSQYCDATGGDYYDFLEVMSMGRASTLVAVGDVMGHGIAAALLMASARAALRAQALQSGSLASMMDIVNRVLAQSRGRSWFMTMFLLAIDPKRASIRWASAGHTLALVHDPATGATRELDGGDLPLGIDGSVAYQEYSLEGLSPNSVMLLGTDGIWETVNETGEPFGIEPVRQILDTFGDLGAEEIASRLRDAVAAHRGDARADDDVTFVVVRLTAERIDAGAPDALRRDESRRAGGPPWPEPALAPSRGAALDPSRHPE